jgi:hypothetical protein
MLDIVETASARRGISRRTALRVGFLGLGSLTLADLLRLRAVAGQEKRETAVILLWVHGGPSHLETYDLKPDAPTEVRGPFRPIQTRSSGLDLCELLPRHAKLADRFTLVRSVAHDQADHGFGTRRFLTGYPEFMPGSDNGPSYYPSLECGVNRSLGVLRDGMPVSVNVGGFAGSPWRGPGIWGAKYQVPVVQVDQGLPNTAMRVEVPRFEARRALLGQLDNIRRVKGTSGAMDDLTSFQRQAHDIILSGKVRAAFDLSKIEPKVRDRYGAGWGQQLLLSLRLIEAGVRFVNVYIPGLPPGSKLSAYNWDDHAVNWDMPTAMRERLPFYDNAIATLIEDLYERGLNERVLLIVSGEFGRTPRLEFKNGVTGRDHWPYAMSILVSGGGKKRGDVIGATDSKGAHPKTRRYDPHDFLATVYNYLGIDPAREYPDLAGRPMPLARGTPIAELV